MPQGHIPIEYLGDGSPSITISGAGRLRFLPDERYLDPDGQPRRLEWLWTDEQVRRLTSPPYNRSGREPLFRVADDILSGSQVADLEKKIKGIVEPMVAEAVEKAVAAALASRAPAKKAPAKKAPAKKAPTG